MNRTDVELPGPESTNGAADVAVAPPAEPDTSASAGAPRRNGGALSRRQFRKLGLLALVIVLSGAAAGLVGGLAWPNTYGARAQILYPITDEQPTGFLREDRNLTTQVVLLQGRPVLGPVAAAEGRSVGDLQDDVTVEVLETSEIIQIEARAGSPEAAEQTVQAIVNRYFALARAEEEPSPLRSFVEAELTSATADLAAADAEATRLQADVDAGTGNLAALSGATTTRDALAGRVADLQTQADEIRVAELSGPAARLATPTFIPDDAVTPKIWFTTTTGALVGLLVAAGAVAVVSRRWLRA